MILFDDGGTPAPLRPPHLSTLRAQQGACCLRGRGVQPVTLLEAKPSTAVTDYTPGLGVSKARSLGGQLRPGEETETPGG